MIWLHCGDQDEVLTTRSLAARFLQNSDVVDILVTAPEALVPSLSSLSPEVFVSAVPADSPTRIRAFLFEWAPRSLIWVGGTLRASLMRAVEAENIPATLINARNATLFPRGVRWRPGAARAAVAGFNKVLTADGATATRLIRGGVPSDRIEATGPILEEPIHLPHDPNELTVMAEAVGTRPIWHAANVVEAEVKDMAAAHLAASRKNHRLLLALTPRDIDQGAQAAATLREAGLSVGLRSNGDEPLTEYQAYVTDLPDELGLWCRIAPLTFIGGTLKGGGALSPYVPTVLGSAIVYGTRKAPHEGRFDRLEQSQAGREVRSTSELGIAVGALIAPEVSARMALAGWQEITRNAETVNQLVEVAVGQSDGVGAL